MATSWGEGRRFVPLSEGFERIQEKKKALYEELERGMENGDDNVTPREAMAAFGKLAHISRLDREQMEWGLRSVSRKRFLDPNPMMAEKDTKVREAKVTLARNVSRSSRSHQEGDSIFDRSPVERRRRRDYAKERKHVSRMYRSQRKERKKWGFFRRLKRGFKSVFGERMIGDRGDLHPRSRTLDWKADVATALRRRYSSLDPSLYTEADASLYMSSREMFGDLPTLVSNLDDHARSLAFQETTDESYGTACTREFVRDEMAFAMSMTTWKRLTSSVGGTKEVHDAFRAVAALDCDYRSPVYDLTPDEGLRDKTRSTVLLRGAEDVRGSMFGDDWKMLEPMLRKSKTVVVVQDLGAYLSSMPSADGMYVEGGPVAPGTTDGPMAGATTSDELVDMLLVHRENPDTFPGVFLFQHASHEEIYVFTVVVHGFFQSIPGCIENERFGKGLSRLQRDIIVRSVEKHVRAGRGDLARVLLSQAFYKCANRQQQLLLVTRGYSALCRSYRGHVHPMQTQGPWPEILAFSCLWIVLEHGLDRMPYAGSVAVYRMLDLAMRNWEPASQDVAPERRTPYETYNGIWLLGKGPTSLHENTGLGRRELLPLYLLSALQDPYLSGVFSVSLVQKGDVIMNMGLVQADASEEAPQWPSLVLPDVVDGVMTSQSGLQSLLSLSALWTEGEGRQDDDDDVAERCATQNGTIFAGHIWGTALDMDAEERPELQMAIVRSEFAGEPSEASIGGALMPSRRADTEDLTERLKRMGQEPGMARAVFTAKFALLGDSRRKELVVNSDRRDAWIRGEMQKMDGKAYRTGTMYQYLKLAVAQYVHRHERAGIGVKGTGIAGDPKALAVKRAGLSPAKLAGIFMSEFVELPGDRQTALLRNPAERNNWLRTAIRKRSGDPRYRDPSVYRFLRSVVSDLLYDVYGDRVVRPHVSPPAPSRRPPVSDDDEEEEGESRMHVDSPDRFPHSAPPLVPDQDGRGLDQVKFLRSTEALLTRALLSRGVDMVPVLNLVAEAIVAYRNHEELMLDDTRRMWLRDLFNSPGPLMRYRRDPHVMPFVEVFLTRRYAPSIIDSVRDPAITDWGLSAKRLAIQMVSASGFVGPAARHVWRAGLEEWLAERMMGTSRKRARLFFDKTAREEWLEAELDTSPYAENHAARDFARRFLQDHYRNAYYARVRKTPRSRRKRIAMFLRWVRGQEIPTAGIVWPKKRS